MPKIIRLISTEEEIPSISLQRDRENQTRNPQNRNASDEVLLSLSEIFLRKKKKKTKEGRENFFDVGKWYETKSGKFFLLQGKKRQVGCIYRGDLTA